jgi:hypothetical protein
MLKTRNPNNNAIKQKVINESVTTNPSSTSTIEEFSVVPNKIVTDFFTDEETDFIKSFADNFPERQYEHDGNEPTMPAGFIEKRIFIFNSVPEYEIINDLIVNRIKQHFHPQVIVGEIKMLTNYFPDRAHTDALFGEYGWDKNSYAAWTLIIPMDNYEARTISFNQISHKTKLLPEYIKDRDPLDVIDKETYEKYFTLESDHNIRFLSIDEIYKWEKAKCFGLSRYKFRSNDNFLKHNVPFTQALMCWTALPKHINVL